MEENLNTNNEVNESKSGNGKITIVIIVIIVLCALGFICYDKFINKEKPPVPTPTSSPVTTPVEDKTSIDGKVILTTENQVINIGDKSLNVRIEKTEDSDVSGSLYIDDVAIVDKDDVNVLAVYAYKTNDFIIFIGYGQRFSVQSEIYQEYITYAIDSDGNDINVDDQVYQLRNIRIDNSELVVTGVNLLDASEDKATPTELVIKFEKNTITVVPKK